MHPRTETIESGKVRNLDVTESLTFQGSPVVPGGGGGSTVKVTVNDTAAATLSSKLIAGSGVTTTVVNPGANEQLSVAVGSLPASAIATGTIDTARLGSGVANNTTFLRGDQTYAVPAYPVTSVNSQTGPVTLTNTDVGAAATVHTHAAGDITSGIIDTARLGSGTASSTTFLRGDQTYAAPVTGFTASQSTAAPNDTVHASRLLASASSANADVVLQPKGSGSVIAQLPDSAATGGNKRGAYAIDFQTNRSAATQVSSGDYTVIGGGQNNTSSNTWSSVLSGNTNLSSGMGAVIGGGRLHTASQTYACVLGGDSNTANATFSSVLGGASNVASGTYANITGGQSNTASGSYATVIGGISNTASGERSVAMGTQAGALSYGAVVQASGAFATTGDCQLERFTMRRQTTTASPAELFLDGSSAGTGKRMTIINDSTYTFQGIVTARRTDADNESAGWKIEGVVDNNANTIAFVGTPTVTALGDDSSGSWGVQVDVDTVDRYLKILVAGQSSKTIRWGATVQLMKVTG